jgi:uncharacterized metal-binding protein YceD (DUF177 family)
MTAKTAFRVADLTQNRPTPFDLRPDAAALRAISADLGLSGLRKLRFVGHIASQGRRDWVLQARLGATVVQPCVVTLAPVTTRIEAEIRRSFLDRWDAPDEFETEMPDDDNIEPLGTEIDPHAVMIESLTLAVPLYPRKDAAGLGKAVFTEPGRSALRDEDVKPFAGLADLRAALKRDT